MIRLGFDVTATFAVPLALHDPCVTVTPISIVGLPSTLLAAMVMLDVFCTDWIVPFLTVQLYVAPL